VSAERVRRERVARLGQLAAEDEERARAELHRADHHLALADRRRADSLRGAADLATGDLSPALRGHLVGVGARHLVELAGQRAELADEADRRRADLARAVTRVRSFERLVGRLDRSAAERRRRRDAADLQDLVAIRAARGER
jgi:hypothetical protein